LWVATYRIGRIEAVTARRGWRPAIRLRSFGDQPVGTSSTHAVSHDALRRAPITFASREIHSETFQRWRTIASQIPAMALGLF
jgi:hypothetical protein